MKKDNKNQEVQKPQAEVAKKVEAPKVEAPKAISILEKIMVPEKIEEAKARLKELGDDSKKLSFIDSVKERKLEDWLKGRKMDKIELVMLTSESRKEYFLFIADTEKNEEMVISRYESIMECKVWTLKFSQLFNQKAQTKIHYYKKGRKNQAQESIGANSQYKDKLQKYSVI